MGVCYVLYKIGQKVAQGAMFPLKLLRDVVYITVQKLER